MVRDGGCAMADIANKRMIENESFIISTPLTAFHSSAFVLWIVGCESLLCLRCQRRSDSGHQTIERESCGSSGERCVFQTTGLLLTMPYQYKIQRSACESENAILGLGHGSAASRISVPQRRGVYSPHCFV